MIRALMGLTFLFCGISFAQKDIVCVRNFLAGGTNTCESFSDRFAYLVNANPDQKLATCAMKRPKSMCDTSDDFTWVISESKEEICVLQWDSGAVDYCAQSPEHYSYIFRNGEKPSDL